MKHAAASIAMVLSLLQTLVVAQVYSRIPSVISSSFRAPNQTLILVFGGNIPVRYPGQFFSQQQVANAPQLGLPRPVLSLNSTTNSTNSTLPLQRRAPSKYAALIVDPNVNNSVPTSVVLHYFLTDLTLTQTSLENGAQLSSGTTRASYRTPSAVNIPHNYTALLFTQPPDFSVPETYNQYLGDNRRGFPLIDFLKDSKLGTAPLAANFFQEGPGGPVAIGTGLSNGTAYATGTGTGASGPIGTASSPYRASTLTPPITSTATATAYATNSQGSATPTASASGRVVSNMGASFGTDVCWSFVAAVLLGFGSFLL